MIALVGFVFVMGVGAIIVATSDKSDEEVASDVMLRAGIQLTNHAIGRCRSKIRQEIEGTLYSPDTTQGDGATIVTLTWNGDNENFKTATCTYMRGKGVTLLKIEDKIVFSRK